VDLEMLNIVTDSMECENMLEGERGTTVL